jgi:two-component system OmpR family response regulator
MTNIATRVLVVDDDHELRNLLSNFLGKHGYEVSTAQNGEELLAVLDEDQAFNLVILDVMMPGMDGIEVCRRVRQFSQIPIIMLTAVNEESDRIISLELGADDYLAKPFNPRELLARMRAILRRASDHDGVHTNGNGQSEGNGASGAAFKFAGWTLDTAIRRLLSPEKVEVALSGGTYDLLIAFLERPQRILSRDQLLDITRHRTCEPFDRTIDVQISRLRQKLEADPKQPQIIKTVRTGGYVFTPEVEKI